MWAFIKMFKIRISDMNALISQPIKNEFNIFLFYSSKVMTK